jgi:universal stress protein A
MAPGMTPKTILVPVDFSAGALQALDYACELASKLDAKIQLVHAIQIALPELGITMTQSMVDDLQRSTVMALEDIAKPRRASVELLPSIVQMGDPRDVIVEASEHADLIIIGTHGRRGISRLVLGSVAEGVLRRASCPVLTVRAYK